MGLRIIYRLQNHGAGRDLGDLVQFPAQARRPYYIPDKWVSKLF